MARVEIYTKAFCSYCARAKRLLDEKGADYEEYRHHLRRARSAPRCWQRANGRTTVPQIFIDGRHVGGSRRPPRARPRGAARSAARRGMKIALFQARTGIDPAANAEELVAARRGGGGGRRGDAVHARDERPARPRPRAGGGASA